MKGFLTVSCHFLWVLSKNKQEASTFGRGVQTSGHGLDVPEAQTTL